MIIASIEVKKLFGYFNHIINFKIDERITIIHGPNGVGKTTILRIMQYIYSEQFHKLCKIPFEEIIIRYHPKGVLRILREILITNRRVPRLTLELQVGNRKIRHKIITITEDEKRDIYRFPKDYIEDIIPHLQRIGRENWLDTTTDEVLSFEDVYMFYRNDLPSGLTDAGKKLPDEIRQNLSESNIYLIETQRLFRQSTRDSHEYSASKKEPQTRMTVEEYARDMVKNIQALLRESGSLSASLDRDFPRRLLEATLPSELEESRIRQMYAEQATYRDRLMAAGLINHEEQVPLPRTTLDPTERKVLWIYLIDVQKKLQLYESLLGQAELLLDIINSRFSYKTMSINKENGFSFVSDHDSSPVPLQTLSSGEQHELVLAYDLLFRVKKNSLVLIDEPELSLHVSWQRKFLDDISRIAKVADLNFLIATHSPSIISNRHDLMVGLANEE